MRLDSLFSGDTNFNQQEHAETDSPPTPSKADSKVLVSVPTLERIDNFVNSFHESELPPMP
jgi:hypothetical protein